MIFGREKKIGHFFFLLETLTALILMGLLFFFISVSLQRINDRYVQIRLSDGEKIRLFVESFLASADEEFKNFLSLSAQEQLSTARMLPSLSDIYLLDKNLRAAKIFKTSPGSRVFRNFSFGAGEMGEFLRNTGDYYQFSSIMRSLEEDGPSMYIQYKTREGIYLARVNILYLRKSLTRIALFAETPVFFLSSDGYVLETTHPELNLFSINVEKYENKTERSFLEAGGERWIPSFSRPRGNLQATIVILLPTGLLNQVNENFFWLFLSFAGVFLLVIFIKHYQTKKQVLRPLSQLTMQLPKVARGDYVEIVGEKQAPFWELRQLYDNFDQMSHALKKREQTIRENSEAMRQEKERLSITLKSIGDGVITTDMEGRVDVLNKVAEKLTGYHAAEARGKMLFDVFTLLDLESHEPILSPLDDILKSGKAVKLGKKILLRSRSGELYRIEDAASPIFDAEGRLAGAVFVFRDVTQEYKIQEQLQHSRKMEAIGQLAGGVAHDFNNMLAAILTSVELLENNPSLNDKAKKHLTTIGKAAGRSADLTAKLLAFARKGKNRSTVIDMSLIVQDTMAILEGSVDKNILLRVENTAQVSGVVGDDAQLQNALLNLAINAVQAMPDGGTLTFGLQNRFLERAYCENSPFELKEGNYLEISVRDTGAGIPLELQKKIFEPFFTTKEQGKGTGLGLSAVYGTVQTHHGAIDLYSETGVGTVFHIYLPVSEEVPSPREERQEINKGTGIILLVDDEELIRVSTHSMLEEMGYEVLVAENGAQALEVYRSRHQEIDLVILDMIMPVMSGRQTFAALKAIDGQCRVVIASGFSKEEDMAELKKQGVKGFISKPYRRHELALLLQEILAK